jgi:hypothetical protein
LSDGRTFYGESNKFLGDRKKGVLEEVREAIGGK